MVRIKGVKRVGAFPRVRLGQAYRAFGKDGEQQGRRDGSALLAGSPSSHDGASTYIRDGDLRSHRSVLGSK